MERLEDRVVDLAVGDHGLARVDARPAVEVGVLAARFLDDELEWRVVPRMASCGDRDVSVSTRDRKRRVSLM